MLETWIHGGQSQHALTLEMVNYCVLGSRRWNLR